MLMLTENTTATVSSNNNVNRSNRHYNRLTATFWRGSFAGQLKSVASSNNRFVAQEFITAIQEGRIEIPMELTEHQVQMLNSLRIYGYEHRIVSHRQPAGTLGKTFLKGSFEGQIQSLRKNPTVERLAQFKEFVKNGLINIPAEITKRQNEIIRFLGFTLIGLRRWEAAAKKAA